MKYIDIIEIGQKPKTKVYSVINKNNLQLGTIQWSSAWRQYCFFPEPDTVFSSDCMDEICGYIKGLNYKQKKGG